MDNTSYEEENVMNESNKIRFFISVLFSLAICLTIGSSVSAEEMQSGNAPQAEMGLTDQQGMPINTPGNVLTKEEEEALSGLVIDILPIESDVVALMDTGVEEEEAVVKISDQWAEKIYQEEILKNPMFAATVPVISKKIQDMLWELGTGDIEGYETPEGFQNRFRRANRLGSINDENPASPI